MITAKEAKLLTTRSFMSSLTDKQLDLYNQIEEWIKEAIENGFYDINKNSHDLDSRNWKDEYGNHSITKLIPYYEELGYSVYVNYTRGDENLIIRWK